jgi:uncharacterized protein YycO
MTHEPLVVVPAGDTAAHPRPGDFILTRSDSLVSTFIRCGARRRYKGEDRIFTRYNHAALIIDEDTVVEALYQTGVTINPLSKYEGREYTLVRANPPGVDPDSEIAQAMRRNAVDFALSCVGRPYGFVTNICIAIGLVTGGNFTFGFDGQSICSGLVARSLERMGFNFGERNPTEVMPADLAYFFRVGAESAAQAEGLVVQLDAAQALSTPAVKKLRNRFAGKRKSVAR